MGYAYYDDCEVYCESCAPKGARPAVNDNETDSPVNCSICGEPVDYALTDYGVEYVLNAIRDTLRKPKADRDRIIPLPGTAEDTMVYYHGSRHVEIVRDWASELSNYNLAREDKNLVSRFLDWTAAR